MIAALRMRHLFPILTGTSLLAATTSASIAADASKWAEDLQSAARLIAAPAVNTPDGRLFRAGVEIRLKDGWKTYWRHPGDSGVPPALNFATSQNVKTVAVLHPAPARFPDGAGGHSVGYTGDVVWPLRVVPENPAKPVTLKLKLDYAVCEKLCVPAQARLELLLTGADAVNGAKVAAAEARVPKAVTVGDGGSPSIRLVRREAGARKQRVVVDVAADAPVTLFAEGPTAQWALPLPEPVSGAPAGLQRFTFELDGLPPGEKPEGATLRLTAVSGDKAVEAAFRLD